MFSGEMLSKKTALSFLLGQKYMFHVAALEWNGRQVEQKVQQVPHMVIKQPE